MGEGYEMRIQGWESKLEEYIEAQRQTPFTWGENDCVLFAANAVNLIIDRDLSADIGKYGAYDKAGAVDIIREHGGSIKGIFDAYLIRRLIKSAQRGDVAVVKIDGREAAGIVTGRYVVCKTPEGVGFVSLDNAVAIWEVR